ncbi:hypothetical protein ACW6B4_001041 [Yersinia ruckeri]|uniref:hypothetical protein n=1 Tax=Yersinia ruckeri TaxID=29486 RepID=UPI0005376529|nr:hypothetical protein [Yersinia ruckeri]AUQ41944.1 hypothetical protein NJ56_08470 [Yersinia ruckeri]AUQ41950.1 hypothetical protein NJ56_08505 [Yersinia ruckeri]WMS06676.1 hypothetical protein RDY86_06005 [Yersinia ruckeri]WMS06681.1 hypothetical protein RDY86_06035 [Yersinia ruckeri]
MKIKESDGTIINVFAIYWFGDETYFYGLPKNYGGLLAYRASQVSIVDPEISFSAIYFENNAKSIQHWALIKEKLLDDILERDEVAYKRFLEILKAEGQIDPDFC